LNNKYFLDGLFDMSARVDLHCKLQHMGLKIYSYHEYGAIMQQYPKQNHRKKRFSRTARFGKRKKVHLWYVPKGFWVIRREI